MIYKLFSYEFTGGEITTLADLEAEPQRQREQESSS